MGGRHNIVVVRELLLAGALVKQGILAFGKLEQALSGSANRLHQKTLPVSHTGIEVWGVEA